MKTLTNVLLLFTCLTILSSFSTSNAVMRTLEGKVFDKKTQTPIATRIEIFRNGNSWFVTSESTGSYSISLPADRSYAVKVFHEGYKNYAQPLFLETDSVNAPLQFDIELDPKTAK